MATSHYLVEEDVLEIQACALQVRVAEKALAMCDVPAEDSELAQVDSELAAYPPGWQVRSYLYASLDHALAWADVVTPMGTQSASVTRLRQRLAFTTSRSAWEAAGAALHILNAEPEERGLRHVGLLHRHMDEQRKAREALGHDSEAKRLAAFVNTLKEGFPGKTFPAAPRYTALAVSAAVHAGIEESRAEYLYRLASAATHGVQWFEGDVFFRMGDVSIPSSEALIEVLRATERITGAATRRYVEFGGYDPIAIWAEATASIWQEVPLAPGIDRETLPTAELLVRRFNEKG